MTRGITALAIAALLIGCAHGLAFKRQSATVLSATEIALTNVRVAEARLTAQHVPGWGPAEHALLVNGLVAAQTAIKAVAMALQVWQPGDPVPATLVGLRTALQQLWVALSGLPLAGHAADLLIPLQAAIDAVQALVLNTGGA